MNIEIKSTEKNSRLSHLHNKTKSKDAGKADICPAFTPSVEYLKTKPNKAKLKKQITYYV